jgi:hypothetical protein
LPQKGTKSTEEKKRRTRMDQPSREASSVAEAVKDKMAGKTSASSAESL